MGIVVAWRIQVIYGQRKASFRCCRGRCDGGSLRRWPLDSHAPLLSLYPLIIYNLDMEEVEQPIKQKKYKVTKVLSAIVTILVALFVIWCIVVTVYPKYQATYATEEYSGETPSSTTSVSYEGSNITTHFTFTGIKRDYFALRSVVHVRQEYHYELSFSSSDLYFMVEKLDINLTFENGAGIISFDDTQLNITKGAIHYITLENLGEIVSYAPSDSSLIIGYNAATA